MEDTIFSPSSCASTEFSLLNLSEDEWTDINQELERKEVHNNQWMQNTQDRTINSPKTPHKEVELSFKLLDSLEASTTFEKRTTLDDANGFGLRYDRTKRKGGRVQDKSIPNDGSTYHLAVPIPTLLKKEIVKEPQVFSFGYFFSILFDANDVTDIWNDITLLEVLAVKGLVAESMCLEG